MSTNQWTTFVVNDELFAVRVDEVQEVLADQALTPVPLAPAHIAGLLNLRGQIMPTVELRQRLHMPVRHAAAEKNLLVLRDGAHSVAVVVDTFGDIMELDANEWLPPPDTVATAHKAHIFGIYPTSNRIVLGLRVATLDGDAHPEETRK